MGIHNVVWRGKVVGSFDRESKTFCKILDYNQNQIFKYLKDNPVGISRDLVRFLLKTYGEIKAFNWTILNLPNQDNFDAYITFADFMSLKTDIFYGKNNPKALNSDVQFVVPLTKFKWRYHGEKILI